MYIFSESFTKFLKSKNDDNQTDYLKKIIYSIDQEFNYKNFKSILNLNKISPIKNIKLEALNWLIEYANFILEDGIIDENELNDFTFLKRVFKIKDGDFLKYKKDKIKEVLKKEFIRIYSDNYIDEKEKLLNLNLQDLFDLGYDEFEDFKKDEVIRSLILGANPRDLDIAYLPKGFKI